MIKSEKYLQFLINWRQKSILPFAILGFLYLAVYALEVIYRSNSDISQIAEICSTSIWIVFAIDVVLKFLGAQRIKTFLKTNVLEILSLVVPFFRILRIFRVVMALRGLQPYLKSRLASTASYLVLLLPITWFVGAIAVLDAESQVGKAVISNLGDALWWSLATITTVGYGELYPVTLEGKFVAAILMITGIALFSACAGMFATWIMGERKSV